MPHGQGRAGQAYTLPHMLETRLVLGRASVRLPLSVDRGGSLTASSSTSMSEKWTQDTPSIGAVHTREFIHMHSCAVLSKKSPLWGIWVAQWLKCPTLAQVMISLLVESEPPSGSVLTACSLGPRACFRFCFHPSAPSPLALSFFLKYK